jgi:hypothetical protein
MHPEGNGTYVLPSSEEAKAETAPRPTNDANLLSLDGRPQTFA